MTDTHTTANSTKTHAQITGGGSALARYRRVMVGRQGMGALAYYEWCQWLSSIPGAPGLALRSLFWPRMFGSCGGGAQFGPGVRCMHPGRIRIGADVVVSDGCVLDGRCPDAETALELEAAVMLSHGVMLSAKGDKVRIGARVGIGPYVVVQATSGNPVDVDADAVIGAHCYLIGGGDYNTERLDVPIAQQGVKVMGGLRVERGVWIGAHATILGGITVGADSIIGAGAVVTKSIPARAVAVGVPARVVRMRE